MMKKLLMCSALLAAFSTMNAQNWAMLDGEMGGRYMNGVTTNFNPTVYASNQNAIVVGSYTENSGITSVGVQSATNYDCCFLVNAKTAGELKAANGKITMIRVKVGNISNSSDHKVWIRKSLSEEPVYVQSCTFTEAGVMQDIVLDTPFEVDGSDFYIGYSLNQKKAQTEGEKFPIAVSKSKRRDTCFLRFGQEEFQDYGSNMGILAVQGICEGDFTGTDAAIRSIQRAYVEKGSKKSIIATVRNAGKTIIKNMDVECTIDGEKQTIKVNTGILASKESKEVEFELDVPKSTGKKGIRLDIMKVNGAEDDNKNNNFTTGDIYIVTQKAHRKTVVEEITSVKCGWCPRGIVGLRKLKQEMPDQSIGIAVHSDGMGKDPYTAFTYQKVANKAKGFPTAFVNRAYDCDPYYGNTNKDFGIADEVTSQNALSAPADVNVKAVVADDKKTIDITGEVTFRLDLDDCSNYRLTYALVQDGLSARQANYFAGQKGQWGPDFDEFVNAPANYNTTLDDTGRYILDWNGIVGSLTGVATADEVKSHNVTMDIDHLGKDENSKININKSRIVAMLIDEKGLIVNANEVELSDGTSIDNSLADSFKPVVSAEYGILNVTGEGAMEVQVFNAAGVQVAGELIADNASIALNGLNGMHVVRILKGEQVFVTKVMF